MKNVTALLLCLFGAVLFAEPGGTAVPSSMEHRSVRDSFTDEVTGAVFPADIGPLRKTEVVRNFNPLIGTVIRYEAGDGVCADIYLYALNSKTPPVSAQDSSDHFEEVKKSILNLPERKGFILNSELLLEENFEFGKAVSGKYAAFRMTCEDHSGIWSGLAVFPFGRTYVKIRMTGFVSKDGTGSLPEFKDFLFRVAELFERASKPYAGSAQ